MWRLLRARSLLRLTPTEPLDVVVTTSMTTVSSIGAAVVRPLTGVGGVLGTAHVARMLGKYYRRKALRVHLSERIVNRLDSDVVLLGGPAKNRFARRLLEVLVPEGVEFDDNRLRAQVGETTIAFETLPIDEGMPNRDVGFVVVTRSPFADHPRVAVLCCGFTSYGTAAAAEWLFGDVHRMSRRKRAQLGLDWKADRKTGGFVGLLDIELSRGRPAAIRLMRSLQISHTK